MKRYLIILEENEADFFREIAKLSKKTIEQVLSDSLQKTCEILMRKCLDK